MRQELSELLDREPFVPFRIVLTSGESHEVRDPHLMAFGESVIHVMTPKSDHYVILRLNQIASIHVLEPAA